MRITSPVWLPNWIESVHVALPANCTARATMLRDAVMNVSQTLGRGIVSYVVDTTSTIPAGDGAPRQIRLRPWPTARTTANRRPSPQPVPHAASRIGGDDVLLVAGGPCPALDQCSDFSGARRQ